MPHQQARTAPAPTGTTGQPPARGGHGGPLAYWQVGWPHAEQPYDASKVWLERIVAHRSAEQAVALVAFSLGLWQWQRDAAVAKRLQLPNLGSVATPFILDTTEHGH